jgi:DNA topoisomerase-3
LPQFQNWDTTDPLTLFDAPTRKEEANPKVTEKYLIFVFSTQTVSAKAWHLILAQAHVRKHLQKEARGADFLILWLDCDREGENICFEVMENTVQWMNESKGE